MKREHGAVLALALCLLLPFGGAVAQVSPPGATLSGRVTGPGGVPVEGVLVSLEGTSVQGLTNAQGLYVMRAVPPGPHVLVTEHLAFAPARVDVTIPARGEVQRNISLADRPLELEGITVTADAVSRAQGEATTATVIAKEAIRHQTAASLAGVLELLPGVEAAPPGLGSVQQISLRAAPTSGMAGSTGSADLASFGTLIIVDGVPLSNNANLQSLGSSGADLSFSTSAGGGVDLRQIPAATLERVEVIRGVPSARYGDLTQGAIIVETRAGAFEPEIRTQYDPNTFETTALGGWDLGVTQSATVNFDYSRTRSMPGVTDDYANRLAGQLTHRFSQDPASPGDPPPLSLDTRVDFYRLEEDLPTNENTRPGFASSARETGLRVSQRARGRFSGDARFSLTGAVTHIWQRSWSAARLVRGAMPFTDRLTPGRSEGWFVAGPYDAELTVEGQPWLIYARGEVEKETAWLGGLHHLRGGIELRREWNSGPGYQFDMAQPPQVSFNGVQGYDRPRAFDDIPALATSGLYLDDRVVGSILGDMAYSLQLGLRLDGLHREGAWAPDFQDAVLQPRLWGELSLRPWLRVRGGWGIMSKAPSQGDLYPAPQYNDVINVNWYTDAPEERLAVLTTYVTDPTNHDLGFSTARKAEAGVEVEGWGSVLSLTGFSDRIRSGVGTMQEPSSLLREYFQLTDSLNGNGVRPRIIEPASAADTVPILVNRPSNVLTMETRGFEVTATLAEIPRIRTRIQVQGSWLRTERRFTQPYFGSSYRFSDFQLSSVKDRAPYWDGVKEIGEKQIVTYRLIHHQPALGFVVTASIQHNVKDLLDDAAARDTLSFAGYVTRGGELVPVPGAERANPEYQDLRVPRGGLLEPLSAPGDWMLGIQASKTLPLEGELRFWGFNALDRLGQYGGAGEQSRVYPRMRFGVELRIAPRVLLEMRP